MEKKKKQKRGHKVVCISIHPDDLADLDEAVRVLKSRGELRANRSALIRFALRRAPLRKFSVA